jgi:hypothetical protein
VVHIVKFDGERVTEDGDGLTEIHAMLPEVQSRLLRIPLEGIAAHPSNVGRSEVPFQMLRCA